MDDRPMPSPLGQPDWAIEKRNLLTILIREVKRGDRLALLLQETEQRLVEMKALLAATERDKTLDGP